MREKTAIYRTMFVLLAIGISGREVGALDRYVSPTGGNAPPFTNWATAANDIQQAVNAATAGDSIWVTNGAYGGAGENAVVITQAITLRSVNGPTNTVITGYQERRALYLNAPGAVVQGFTFTAGKAQDGGGAYLLAGTVRDCVISNNIAQGPPGDGAQPAGRGGGAFVVGGALLDCLVTDNEARGGDGLDGMPGMDAPPGMNGMTEGAPGENGMDGGNAMSSWAVHGGQAEGGGVFFGHGQLKGCEILKNRAIGGNGSTGAKGGNGGAGGHGANGVMVIADGGYGGSGGRGGNGGYGGSGGRALGGGVFADSASMWNCVIAGNLARGGAGGRGGDGGNGGAGGNGGSSYNPGGGQGGNGGNGGIGGNPEVSGIPGHTDGGGLYLNVMDQPVYNCLIYSNVSQSANGPEVSNAGSGGNGGAGGNAMGTGFSGGNGGQGGNGASVSSGGMSPGWVRAGGAFAHDAVIWNFTFADNSLDIGTPSTSGIGDPLTSGGWPGAAGAGGPPGMGDPMGASGNAGFPGTANPSTGFSGHADSSQIGGLGAFCHNTVVAGLPDAIGGVTFYFSNTPTPQPGPGNISQDPMFGPGYVLLPGSPCIDSGTNSGPAVDLAGVPRPLDGDNNGDAAFDMGVYEYVHDLADTDFDGLRDTNELALHIDPTKPDTDGDGCRDNVEVIAGTDPVNASSSFALMSAESGVSETGMTLQWPFAGGRIYRIYWSDLPLWNDMVWSFDELGAGEFTVSGGTASWTEPTPPPVAARVYRVGVRLE